MYNILLVDDEWTYRYLISKMIRGSSVDFTVALEVNNGEEALLALTEKSYDLILTDIRMPVMDGITLLKNVNKNNKDIPLVLISSYSDFEYARNGIIYGAFDYLLKPIEPEKLFYMLDQVKKHLDLLSLKKFEYNDLIIDEDEVYKFLFKSSDVLSDFISNLTKKYIETNNNYLKLGMLFEKLISNIQDKLLNNFNYVKKLYRKSNFSKDILSNINENSLFIKIESEFSRIHDFIYTFHLDIDDNVVQKISSQIMLDLESSYTLNDIALKLNYNCDYLGRYFKSKTGENFTQFYTKIKLEYSITLLQNGNYKVYEISEKLGYKDTEYFSKLFKKYTGYNPSEYMKFILAK